MKKFLCMPSLDAVLPCVADPSMIRFTSLLDRDVSFILPYVNAVVRGAIYNREARTLTVKRGRSIITVHPTKIAGAKLADRAAARRALEGIVELINGCHERMAEIEPNYERRGALGVLDVYKLLPGTNCGRCGQATCLAFAAGLAKEAANISQCPSIYAAEFQKKREVLARMMADAGYSVPEFT